MALNDVPLTGQTLAITRDPIRQNFLTINSVFGINHVVFNGGADQGKHKFIEMPTAVPTIATTATEIGLYSNNGSVSGVPELFFQRANQAANSGYAITEGVGTTNGWTRLPSGYILQWGETNLNGVQPFTVTFPLVFPNNCFNVQIVLKSAALDVNAIVYLTAKAAANFTCRAWQRTAANVPATGLTINWFAVGG